MNPGLLAAYRSRVRVSIRTRPEGRVNQLIAGHHLVGNEGSIRTRPEGRVNLLISAPIPRIAIVSIRTRPEGRVNPDHAGSSDGAAKFQSAPGPRAG